MHPMGTDSESVSVAPITQIPDKKPSREEQIFQKQQILEELQVIYLFPAIL